MKGPVFFVAPLRSGGTIVADALGASPGFVRAPGRLEAAIAAACGARERLTAADATPEVRAALRRDLESLAGERRLLDEAPAHALRVPFLHAVFPEATFVYLYREPRRAVWDAGRGARESIEELAQRWRDVTALLLDDLSRLPPASWMVAAYRLVTEQPETAVARVADFLGVAWDGTLPPRPAEQPSPPPEIVAELDRADGLTRAVADRARDLFAAPPPRTEASFRSVATPSFAPLLWRLGVSLAVSTYQSGRLILVRPESPTALNTHFRPFESPMGIAVSNGRLLVGTAREVWDFRNMPAVASKVEPPGKHDACYVPRKIHVTGDVRVHEIALAGGEVWLAATRFSALCTLDADSSFVPRWKPPFVTRLAAEDRCHLNGLALEGGRVRYVTALGETDTAGGWRPGKAAGGLVIDVASGEAVLRGLSMPHSPRIHEGRFYLLESGKGTLAAADLASGRVEMIAELPGFTRGLAFAGPFAFVGLSQVRESNVFGGIPLTERVAERECGVWAIDLRTGRPAAFLRFTGDVREIFDVQVLRGTRYPELLELGSPLVAGSFSVPDEMLAQFGA